MDYKIKGKNGLDLHGAHGHKVELSDQMLAVELSKLLSDNYPGYQWVIAVNSDGGVIDIKNWDISWEWGYRIGGKGKTFQSMTHDALRHMAIMAGGEILERAKLKRGKIDEAILPEWVDGITKPQDQPIVQRNIHKYAELLNGPTVKH